jgi:mannose-6-phosphate isomerase-like protein (cupin superfamily)
VSASYTHKKLAEVEDSAVKFGISETQEARFATEALDAQDTGFSHQLVKAEKRQAFAHKHENAEEVYVVIAGSGRAKLDDDVIELERLDALRVAPGVTRAFEAGPNDLELLVFGPRREGDGEIIPGWWSD